MLKNFYINIEKFKCILGFCEILEGERVLKIELKIKINI